MYKVDYHTLAVCEKNSLGITKQFSDTWYTETSIPLISIKLKSIVNRKYGDKNIFQL